MMDERLSMGLASLTMDSADGDIVAEIQSRHGNSAQPESQQVLAVLQAVLEVISAEGMSATPTTIFAALMSALDRPDAQSSPVTALAMCTLLGVTLTRVPNSVLRSKFVSSVQLLSKVVECHKQQAAACKAALLCLGQVLAAVEPGSWHAASPGFQLLISFLTDARPKVRRRAQGSATDILAALQTSPASLAAASEAIIALCKVVLPGPAAAARAAAAASNKQRAAAESAIAAAVSDVLHLLGALKTWAPLMAGPCLPGLIDLLMKLYILRQPLLSRHTSEVLGGLAASPVSHITPGQLQQLLSLLVDGEAASLLGGAGSGGGSGGGGGGDQLSAMASLLEGGLPRLAGLSPEGAGRLMPKVVHLLVPLLSAEQDGVRYSASGALQSLLSTCLTPQLVAALAAQQPRAGGGLPPLQSLVAAVASSLGARYQEAWGLALPVVGVLCEVLAAGGAAPLAAPLVSALGHICAGLSDEAEQLEQQMDDMQDAGAPGAASSSSSYASAAEAAMGKAIRCLGPQQVLAVLPLQLHEGLAGTGEPRTWLLPALRKHVRGTQLAYWAANLLPLARQMGGAAAAASAAGRKGSAVACHALELQLWGCLQAFASWPTDAAAAYPGIAADLAAAFHTREDLRGIIAAVLVRLCKQARGVALLASQGGLAASPKTLAAIQGLGLVSGAAAAVPGAGRGGEAADEEEDDEQNDVSDDEDDYAGGRGLQQQQQRRRGGGLGSGFSGRGGGSSSSGEDEGPDAASAAPGSFSADVALAQLLALRGVSNKWLPLMCRVFLEVEPEGRGAVGEVLAAYASVTDAALLAGLFRVALTKYAKIGRDAGAAVPPPDPILEGGGSPDERQASFLELALCLAGGLPDAALDPLFAACRQHVLGGSSLLQKRSYRVLAYLAAARPQWLAAHLAAVLELLLLGSGAALSPAKRYRLRCLRPLILLLDSTPCPPLPGLVDAASGAEAVPGGAALAAAAAAAGDGTDRATERRRVVLAQLLVGELVLATKEVNKKTRSAAYQLIVDIAHELDESRPLNLNGADGLNPGGDSSSNDDEMEYGDDVKSVRGGHRGGRPPSQPASGGLLDFVNAVLGGLVGSSPHMQSAAVLALARLAFEFAGQLEGLVGRLLPAVLLLLRSQSREVIKAVLGFIKVCAMRMPVDLLLVWLPQMLEGMLIWADDSKNKFRLKIRVIMERLVRRCGLDAVAAACPPGDAKLLAHIRKQGARKERRKAGGSEGGSQVDAAEFDRRSQRSAGSGARSAAGRTARASEWGHTAIFSDHGADEQNNVNDGRHRAGSVAGGGRGGGPGRGRGGRGGAGGVRLAGDGAAADPQDLLEASTARQLVRSAAGAAAGGRGSAAGAASADGDRDRNRDRDFPRGDDGRLVIKEGEPEDEFGWKKKKAFGGKRKRADDDFGGFGSEGDSDMEDMRGFAGLKAAVASVANAKSVKFAPSIAMSLGNRSNASNGSGYGGGSGRGGKGGYKGGGGKGSQHSGERFKPKAAGAAGDVKGKSGVDPYAYWQFDRKMLNRRRGKQAAASKGLGGVVAGAQAGALKGGKAKRAAQAKRARR